MALVVKNVPANAGDVRNIRNSGSVPKWGNSPEGHGHPLQYSCLENLKDSGACGLQSIVSQRVGNLACVQAVVSKVRAS